MSLVGFLIGVASNATARRRVQALEGLIAEGVLTIGTGTYGTPTIRVWRGRDGVNRGGRVSVGRYVSIADHVEIFTGGEHRTDWVSTYPFRERLGLRGAGIDGHPRSKGDVVIGNDVWIGAGATILSGSEIGDGAVIAARAVIAGSVRPYAIVAGNPAREVRSRFDVLTVQALLRIRWWDLPEDIIRERISELSDDAIDTFIGKYDPGAPNEA